MYHEQNNIGSQYIGHDAENTITLIKDAGTQVWECVPRMLDEFRYIFTVTENTIQQHDGADNDEYITNNTPRNFDADNDANHGDPLIELSFSAGAIIYCLKIMPPMCEVN